MIVLAGRQRPPTLEERKAAVRARVRRYLRHACIVAAVLAPFTLALALWLATRAETGWAVTAACLSLPMFVAGVSRLTDVPAQEMPR